MKQVLKKVLSLTLVMGLLLVMAPAAYGASVIPVKVSSSFKSSVYYTEANKAYNKYKNASDAERFVRVAMSQEGYKGSNKTGQYNGTPAKRGKYTEYSRWAGANGLAWCASFVSWSAAAAGISEKVIVPGTGCGHWQKKAPNGGTFHKLWTNNFKTYNDYKPQVGDIALYTPTCSTCGKHFDSYSKSSHAVIVTDVADKRNKDGSWTFKTIERGDNNTVQTKTVTTKQTRDKKGSCACKKQTDREKYAYVVQGFFHPKWADGKSAPNHLDNTGTQSSGTQNTTAPSAAVKLSASDTITSNNAVLGAGITKPSGSTLNYVGLVMYCGDTVICDKTFTVSSVTKSTTSFSVSFDVQKNMGVTLKPGTTYKYRVYTKVDNVKYVSDYRTFTTKAAAVVTPTPTPTPVPTPTPAPTTPAASPVTVTYPTDPAYLAKFSYTRNNAVLVAHITKPSGSTVNYVGLVMYCNGTAVCDKTFAVTNVSKSTTSFHAWFDVQKEMGVTLKPGTTYKYRIYTKVDNVKYVSEYRTFTTPV